MSDILYIDRLTYQEAGSRSAKVLSGAALDEKKIAKVLSLIGQGKLKLVDAVHEEEGLSMTLRMDGQKIWIGVLDSCNEISYIYDNRSGSEHDVAVAGDDYPGWAICRDAELAKEILSEFVHSGNRLPSVTWREDDM